MKNKKSKATKKSKTEKRNKPKKLSKALQNAPLHVRKTGKPKLPSKAASTSASSPTADHTQVAPVAPAQPQESGGRKKQSELIVTCALKTGAEPFRTPTQQLYARVPIRNHFENLPLRSNRFRAGLTAQYARFHGKPPATQSLEEALRYLEAWAELNGKEYEVYTRIAAVGDVVYIDLGDSDWTTIAISRSGWDYVNNPPVRFRRHQNMAPLPRPVRGGTISELRRFVNVGGDYNWILFVAFLLAALRGIGPYIILLLIAGQGSAKSTIGKVIKVLLDPVATAPHRSFPKNEQDLAIAAKNASVLVYDNISKMPPWLSDALCRLATGSGFATRQLYTDDGEVIFGGQRPICLNGIEEFAERADLLDRSIILYLPALPEERRRDEAEFWGEFNQALPRILGALYDAVSEGLRNLPSVRLDRKPRMADFAKWIVACEPAMPCAPGTFMEAYEANRSNVLDLTVEGNHVVDAVRQFMLGKRTWAGTATELLLSLQAISPQVILHGAGDPRSLSNQLRRNAQSLQRIGLGTEFPDEGPGGRIQGKRLIIITQLQQEVANAGTAAD